MTDQPFRAAEVVPDEGPFRSDEDRTWLYRLAVYAGKPVSLEFSKDAPDMGDGVAMMRSVGQQLMALGQRMATYTGDGGDEE